MTVVNWINQFGALGWWITFLLVILSVELVACAVIWMYCVWHRIPLGYGRRIVPHTVTESNIKITNCSFK